MPSTILITGANGQVGTTLTTELRRRYGSHRVIASDISPPRDAEGRFIRLDVTDGPSVTELIRREGVTQVYHLAAILSANGEADPLRSWRINMDALLNVLEAARTEGIERVFYPSSIAVFGNNVAGVNTPDESILNPTTVYGISKAAGENWANYYHMRFGVDVRSIRYPGIIGHGSKPGGGTTDYAVEVFYRAVQHQAYTCYLAPDTTLPMIYMDDAVRATIELMEAPADSIRRRTSYNLSGCSFSPAEVTEAIRNYYPQFTLQYAPDFRQAIAASWPKSIDDSAARQDWGWQPAYSLERLCEGMITALRKQYEDSAAGAATRERNLA